MTDPKPEIKSIADLVSRDTMPVTALLSAISALPLQGPLRQEVHGLLKRRLDQLEHVPDALVATDQWKRDRGYRFEELLTLLFELEGLAPSRPFRARGEQIDGLFHFQNRYVLVEAKWQATAVPASTLYEFWGKVSGKLDGTLGLFVSMEGYSDDAARALEKGKVLSVLLMDGDEVRAAFAEFGLLTKILDIKMRAASQKGVLYYSWNTHKDLENA